MPNANQQEALEKLSDRKMKNRRIVEEKGEADRASDDLKTAIGRIEKTLQQRGIRRRLWILLARRTMKGQASERTLEISLGFSDEPDGTWAFRLRSVDRSGKMYPRYALLSEFPPGLVVNLLPWLRKLIKVLIFETKRLAESLEIALEEISKLNKDLRG